MQLQPMRDYSGAAAATEDQLGLLMDGTTGEGTAADIRIALIGTFTPRKCGIATFTSDIVEQLGKFHPEIDVDVYALDRADTDQVYELPRQVIAVDQARSFAAAAEAINASDVQAVWLQHEFGIFGENDGEAICGFVDRIAAPLVVTFHTVLGAPSARQSRIMRHLVSRASQLMVMSREGRELLIGVYGAPPDTVRVIQHGAPDRRFGRSAAFKKHFGLANRNVLMTFGLLGPGKGLERVIEAMPAIVARHPRTIYRIVGATHPNLVAAQGEAYRDELQRLTARLGVEAHIAWDNRFLDTAELLDQLEACDVYVTPYMNLQQSTSGTLSYAVALGKAVVSTPYVHARELLAGGVGVLVEPDSHEAIAKAIVDLLDDPARLLAVQRKAYETGRGTVWQEFAHASAALVRAAIRDEAIRDWAMEVAGDVAPSLSAVFDMSDGTGVLQHAIGIVPDRNHGYCLDDNARALMLMNVATGLSSVERRRRSLAYAGFVQHAWNASAARFRNFMRYDRGWAEDVGSEDSNGRALWALGHTIERTRDADLRWWALRLFDRTAPALASFASPRAMAFNVLGGCAVLRGLGRHAEAAALVAQGGDALARLLAAARRPDWEWFEDVLAYDNPRLPQALIEAGDLCRRADWIDAGLRTLEWIGDRQTASDGTFRPIGSESFGREGAHLPFDQQPLEALAAIEAAEAALTVTGDTGWLHRARCAYAWFFGANDRGAVLGDLATGRCRDGVTPRGRNENCGAESILAFQLAHYALRRQQGAADALAAPGVPLPASPASTGGIPDPARSAHPA